MKLLAGLILFSSAFAFSASDKNTKTSILHLRGRVPASTQIEFNDKENSEPTIKTNSKYKPKLIVSPVKKSSRQITVIHP